VTLTVTDNSGGTDTDSTYANIMEKPNSPPTADFYFLPINATTNDTIQFTDLSKDIDGTIVLWHWTFGDGTNSTEKNPAHRYYQSGIYGVTLNVTDNDGAFSSSNKMILVEKSRNTGLTATGTKGTPGFELIIILSAVSLIILWKLREKSKQ
jgi:PKD repeat protein